MKGIGVDTGVQAQLTRLVARVGGQCQIGALLVRKLANGSRVFVLAAVPFKDEDDGLGWGPNVSDVPRHVLEAQVDAVGRMLVGGISVGGIYAVSREQGKAAVEALYRLWPASSVVVHVSGESSQFTVRAVTGGGAAGKGLASSSSNGGGGGGAELAVVEVKYQSVANKLITYHCMVDVALEFSAPCSEAGDSSSNNSSNGKAAVARLLGEEDAFFRAFLRATKAEEALLEQAVCFPAVGEDGGEEGRFTRIGPNLARVVDVYTPAFVAPPPQPAGAGGKQQRSVRVCGSVGSVACVHEKESDQEGLAALKEDCLRSLQDRVHILREEAATELEEGGAALASDPTSLTHALHSASGGALRLPRRVLLPFDPQSASSMLVADYLLPGESLGEALGRLRDTLCMPAAPGVEEAALILPELEAAVDGAEAPAAGAGIAPLGRISSCISLSMGRAPSTSSLLLERGHSCGSLPRTGSAVGFPLQEEEDGEEDEEEGEHGQPVSMDADEEGGAEGGVVRGDAGATLHVMPPSGVEEGKGLADSLTSSPQLLVCMLVVGLAMVVGVALLHPEAQKMG